MRTLFISGSGFNVFVQGGALKYIFGLGKSFDIYAGTSSGAYLALALHLGWKPEELYQWGIKTDRETRHDLKESWLNLIYGSFISDAGKASFIRKMIQASPVYQEHFSGKDPEALTFSQISQVVPTKFLCNSTCLETNGRKVEIFSDWTTPDLSIHWAVMASMSLVGLFRPAVRLGKKYIDGAFTVDYLPICFRPGTNYYYKRLGIDVDIPIDLNNSWGVLFTSKSTDLDLEGEWSLVSLFKFIKVAIQLFNQNEIMAEPHSEMQRRTWRVTNEDILTFPEVPQIEEMYKKGFEQAVQQGELL